MSTEVVREPAARLSAEQATERLVDAALDLLAEKGPSELKARTVAEAAGMSTTALYYHLGGMPELFQAVVDRGYTALDKAFVSGPIGTDAVRDLFAMALAARMLAQQSPHLYDLMFGLSTRGSYRASASLPPVGRTDAFQSTYAHLVAACGRLLAQGRVRADCSAAQIADQLWSCVHGFVMLELGGHFIDRADPVTEVLMEMTVNVLVGLGDERSRCTQSHRLALLPPR